jgi:putative PIN family toxin of toxin-antitoxin system
VVDTNVLFAALVANGLCREVVRKHVRNHRLIASQVLLDEFAEKIRHKLGQDPGDVPFYTAYAGRVHIVVSQALPAPVCRDSDDDVVLAAALAGSADAIITGDKDLLVLKKFRKIRILSPRQFLELVEAGGS